MQYALYIHVPFCRKRCNYCDFYTSGGNKTVPDAYINAILREFNRYAPKDEKGEKIRPSTLYFGGGTPALLSGEQLKKMINTFAPLDNTEITLEVNPEDAGKNEFEMYYAAGVNRISIGVQSADNQSLARLGRRNTAKEAANAFKAAANAGFSNISGDIMLALPEYSEKELEETIELVVNGGAKHISAYMLNIEENTPFGRQIPPNLPDTDKAAEYYTLAVDYLAKKGFARYEISNFAQPGFEGRHNLAYWNCGDYLGLGPSAHSCIAGRRFFFESDTNAFMQKGLPPQQDGVCDAEDFIMLQLRLSAGLSLQELKGKFDYEMQPRQLKKLNLFAQQGFAKKSGEYWQLTTKGVLVQNELLTQLLV